MNIIITINIVITRTHTSSRVSEVETQAVGSSESRELLIEVRNIL